MAQEAQGSIIRRASSVVLSYGTTAGFQITTAAGDDFILSTHATADFNTLGIVAGMRIRVNSTKNEGIVTVKAMTAASKFTIYEDFSTGHTATNLILYAYNMMDIGEVVGWSGPNESAAVIDITNLQSTVKEKMISIRDSGEVSLDVFFTQESTQKQRLRSDLTNKTINYYDIVLNDSASLDSYFFFQAYPTGFSVQGAVDQAIKGSITLAITGGVQETTRR